MFHSGRRGSRSRFQQRRTWPPQKLPPYTTFSSASPLLSRNYLVDASLCASAKMGRVSIGPLSPRRSQAWRSMARPLGFEAVFLGVLRRRRRRRRRQARCSRIPADSRRDCGAEGTYSPGLAASETTPGRARGQRRPAADDVDSQGRKLACRRPTHDVTAGQFARASTPACVLPAKSSSSNSGAESTMTYNDHSPMSGLSRHAGRVPAQNRRSLRS